MVRLSTLLLSRPEFLAQVSRRANPRGVLSFTAGQAF
jgi:hypothetical protein